MLLLKTKWSTEPRHTRSRRSSSSAPPLSSPAPDSHREHDLHQGNSGNGLAHRHHPWLTYPQQSTYSFCSVCLSVCLPAGVPAPEGRTQTAGLKVPLTHLQGRKGPWSLWLLISVSKIQHTRPCVLTHPLPLPHLILKAILVDRGRGGSVSAAPLQLPL